MDATGYLKHNATVQVASGAVDCLFARELIRQFVVQNPAEVTDKAVSYTHLDVYKRQACRSWLCLSPSPALSWQP